jgi:hypothetical protein
LVAGARKKARKYNTYELVLTSFAVAPLKFSLTRYDIEERIGNSGVAADQKPPSASVGSMLKALGELQRRRGIELLEWRPLEQTLYILEPSFLFYIRWRELRKTRNFKIILDDMVQLFQTELSKIEFKPIRVFVSHAGTKT